MNTTLTNPKRAFITIREASKILGISYLSARQWAIDGKIPSLPRANDRERWLIPIRAFEEKFGIGITGEAKDGTTKW